MEDRGPSELGPLLGMHVRKLPTPGTEQAARIKGAVPSTHTELGIVRLPTSQHRNPHITGEGTYQGLASVVGDN